jgi:site-specific DNA recombinase
MEEAAVVGSDDLHIVRAATYSRVSTQQQAQEGFNLAEYVRLTAEYVRGRDWLLVGEYVDAGVSGRRNDRVQWNALLAACRRAEVDAVVVHALSRFSRSARDAINRINELRGLGIDFISLKESFDSRTANGRAMLGMTAVFAQLEAEQTAERSTLAQRAKARQGLWPGGSVPYGWRLEGDGRDAHPVPDRREREAITVAVRHILAENGTTGSAAALLNSLGHTGRQGGAWTHQRVLRTLTAPSLTGQVAWAKPNRPYVHSTRLDPRTREPVWGPTVDFAISEPPLDPDTYDRLQQALSRRRYGFKRPARPYPLSGMLCPSGQDHSMGGVASRDRRTYRCKHARWSADAAPSTLPDATPRRRVGRAVGGRPDLVTDRSDGGDGCRRASHPVIGRRRRRG